MKSMNTGVMNSHGVARCFGTLLALLGVMVLPRFALAAKQPAPSEAAQSKAEAEIKSLFKKEFAAATTASRKLELSETLVKQAAEIKGEPAAQYVMLHDAATLAAAAGELTIAMQYVDELVKGYEVDSVRLKSEAVAAAAKAAVNPSQRAAVVETAVVVRDAAAASDEFEIGKQMGELALKLAKEPSVKKQISQHNRDLDHRAKAYAAVKEDIDAVKRNAADSAAQFNVGKYYLFTKGDWKAALPLLANSSDPTWKQAASAELANPTTPADQLKTADGWWALAEKQEADGKHLLQVKACDWYRKLLTAVTGITKSRIEKCIVDVDGMIVLDSKTMTAAPVSNFAKYDNLQFDVGTGPHPGGLGGGFAGVEMDKCSRLQVTLDAFPTYTRKDVNAYVGFMVDYHTASGYVKRVGLPVGSQFDRGHTDALPPWGKQTAPSEHFDLGKRQVYELDLKAWAPKDWDGRVWFSAVTVNSGVNSRLTGRIAPQK